MIVGNSMGQVRKINDEYYIEFYARGLLYQQKAGEDLASAQRLLQEIETKITHGEMGTIVRDVDWDIFLQTFSEQVLNHYAPPTARRYQNLIHHLSQFLRTQHPQILKLSQVTPKIVEDYRFHLTQEAQRLKLKPKTLNFTLYLLRDVLDYGIKLGYINDNPTVHTRFFIVKEFKQPPVVTSEQRLIQELCQKGVPLLTIGKRLEFKDIARVMRYSGFVKTSDP